MHNRMHFVVSTKPCWKHIGRRIIEEEQQGSNRAAYGKAQMKNLSARLNKEFGKGFSVDNLENMRRFYITYPSFHIEADKIGATSIPRKVISETPSRIFQIPDFQLSWSHYLLLMRIDDEKERAFYEIEATKNNWSLGFGLGCTYGWHGFRLAKQKNLDIQA